MLLLYTGLLFLQGVASVSVPPSKRRDILCQQCISWCEIEALPGPRGPAGPPGRRGYRGITGHKGRYGGTGRKGDRGRLARLDLDRLEEMVDIKLQRILPRVKESEKVPFQSCRDVRKSFPTEEKVTSGLANITFYKLGRIEVYCDFEGRSDWLVIQRRTNGGVDFYLGWDDYVDGFGDKEGEFWIGLEIIHRLTSVRKWELQIDMVDRKTNKTYFVKYRWFRIGPAWDKYRLLNVEGSRGDTDDSLHPYHWHQKFSTFDSDNDDDPSQNCALQWHGAWWYKGCSLVYSSLNGNFHSTWYDGMGWYGYKKDIWMNLKATKMKIRPQR